MNKMQKEIAQIIASRVNEINTCLASEEYKRRAESQLSILAFEAVRRFQESDNKFKSDEFIIACGL